MSPKWHWNNGKSKTHIMHSLDRLHLSSNWYLQWLQMILPMKSRFRFCSYSVILLINLMSEKLISFNITIFNRLEIHFKGAGLRHFTQVPHTRFQLRSSAELNDLINDKPHFPAKAYCVFFQNLFDKQQCVSSHGVICQIITSTLYN